MRTPPPPSGQQRGAVPVKFLAPLFTRNSPQWKPVLSQGKAVTSVRKQSCLLTHKSTALVFLSLVIAGGYPLLPRRFNSGQVCGVQGRAQSYILMCWRLALGVSQSEQHSSPLNHLFRFLGKGKRVVCLLLDSHYLGIRVPYSLFWSHPACGSN